MLILSNCKKIVIIIGIIEEEDEVEAEAEAEEIEVDIFNQINLIFLIIIIIIMVINSKIIIIRMDIGIITSGIIKDIIIIIIEEGEIMHTVIGIITIEEEDKIMAISNRIIPTNNSSE